MPNVFRRTLNKGYISTTSRQTRIVVPQPDKRPIHLRQKRLIRYTELQNNPWWWISHRRGFKRPLVGPDPRETRAIPHSMVKGTLPERIVFKALLDLHMVSGVDFDFQSSQQGGRIEMGGLVVDFLFRALRLVIQVQGPTHTQFLRGKKDEEQTQILADMGYTVVEWDEDLIYNPPAFDNALRQVFNLGGFVGGGAVEGYLEDTDEILRLDITTVAADVERLFNQILGAAV